MDKTYIARISKIDELKSSRTEGAFKRIYFQVKDPINSTPEKKQYFWAKTDVVMSYRNYARWKQYLKVGNVLSNLKMKGKKMDTIDADSIPKFEGYREEEPVMESLLQQQLLK